MEKGILNLLNWIEEAKTKVSLRDYASSDADFVEFGDTYIGYSPFDDLSHDNYLDRRLMVKDDKYLCLSTGKSGDIIDYIMLKSNLSFREALEELEHLSGTKMPDIEGEIEERVRNNEKRDRLYALMRDTMVHYFNNLKDPRAKIAVDYLEKRGFEDVLTVDNSGRAKITNEIVCTFALGYSLDENALVDAMHAKGYTNEEMDECGLVYLKNGKAYDVMAGRLIIPILNRHNKVIAFSGRIFEAKGHQKYRNTGNTTLFSKKNELYGANNLVAHQGKLNEVYVVEGYMDVISLYKEGIKNAVASMGTALTSDHAKILKNYSDNIYLTYDGDDAGQNAIRRGVDVLYEEGIISNVITLPGGQDPDEIIKANGVEYFIDLKNSARNMIEFKIDDLARTYNMDEADDKGDYAVKAVDLLIKYKVNSSDYIKRISDIAGISYDVIAGEMHGKFQESLMQDNKKKETKQLSPLEKCVINILGDMLTNKSDYSLSIFLTSSEEKNAYNYMRLMGKGTDEEEYSELFEGELASHLFMLKDIDKDTLSKMGKQSYDKISLDLIKGVGAKLIDIYSKHCDSNEKKYIINACVMAYTKLMKDINMRSKRA